MQILLGAREVDLARARAAKRLDTGTIGTAPVEREDTPKAVAGQRPQDIPKTTMEVLALALRRELAT